MENNPDTDVSRRRKRTSIACKRCRERKLRCDGHKPECQACSKSGAPCEYRDHRVNPRVQFVMHYFSPPEGDSSSSSSSGRRRSGPAVDESMLTTVKNSPPATPAEATAPETAPKEHPEPVVAPVSAPGSHPVRIPFFRWFGPTGIAPGYKKMLFDVRHSNQPPDRDMQSIHTAASPRSEDSSAPAGLMKQIMNTHSPLFEDDNITPTSSILYPLLETFFDYYGCHFPFYSRGPFTQSVKDRKVSSLLLNTMCGLAARFSNLPEVCVGPLYLRGDIFAEKAKFLLVPLLNLPSHETVASILMVVWLELANNHDVGVWMYMGMACRMAVDLGMHKAAISGPGSITDPAEYWMVSTMFWAVNFHDHIISFATGRPLTVQPDYIDVPYPPQSSDPYPSPFRSMVVVIQTQGLVNSEINKLSDQSAILAPAMRERLSRYSDELITFYANLSPTLTFDINNFQAYVAKGEGGVFLLLHLWFNAVMIAVHRPGLRYGQSAESNKILLNNESRGIALSSARTISSILSLTEVVDPMSLVSSPFTDQAIEMAGLVFAAESLETSNTVKTLTNRSNYEICLRTLQTLVACWKGVGWVTTTMEQKFKGLPETDPAEGSVDPQSLIDLQDSRMIQKLLEKVERSTPQQLNNSSSSIGIGFSGMTSDSAHGSVMFLQPNNPFHNSSSSSSTNDNTSNNNNSIAPNYWTNDSPQFSLHTAGMIQAATSPPLSNLRTTSTATPTTTNNTAYFTPQLAVGQPALINGDAWMMSMSWEDHNFWEQLDVPINPGGS